MKNHPDPMQHRPFLPALLSGWKCRCPACKDGAMMQGYLTVGCKCENCDEPLHHHRADDGPAFFTILICGHIMAPLMVFFFDRYNPDTALFTISFGTGFVLLALFLLPRIKGMFVALQWAKRMHGFGMGVGEIEPPSSFGYNRAP